MIPGQQQESEYSTTGANADNPPDNGEEDNETTRHSTNNSTMAVKSEPVQQQQHNDADAPAKNSGGNEMNISAYLK